MLRRSVLFLVLLLALGSSHAADLEITPFVGYRFGGEIDSDSNPVVFMSNADVDASGTYGLALGIRPKAGLLIELSADRQQTELLESGPFLGGDTPLFDADVTYYHVGAGWIWAGDDWEGFITGSIGVAELDPDSAVLSSEDDFSVSVGGGIKVWAHRHVGFRFELRGYWANFETGDADWWDEIGDGFYQGQVRVGVVVRF